jgi:hypothetical protein
MADAVVEVAAQLMIVLGPCCDASLAASTLIGKLAKFKVKNVSKKVIVGEILALPYKRMKHSAIAIYHRFRILLQKLQHECREVCIVV